MQRDVSEMMHSLRCRLALHEALAAKDARKAFEIELTGRCEEAEALRTLARAHRVRTLDLGAQLESLRMRLDTGRG